MTLYCIYISYLCRYVSQHYMRIFLVHLYSLYFLFEQMIWGPMSETRVEIEPFVAAGIRLLFLSLSLFYKSKGRSRIAPRNATYVFFCDSRRLSQRARILKLQKQNDQYKEIQIRKFNKHIMINYPTHVRISKFVVSYLNNTIFLLYLFWTTHPTAQVVGCIIQKRQILAYCTHTVPSLLTETDRDSKE